MDRSLPYNAEAEQAVVGSCLLNREAIIVLAPWFESAYFYVEANAWVYEAEMACYQKRVPTDLTTVSDELRRRGRLDKIGGLPYLMTLMDAVTTSAHIEYYARIVERTAIRRRVITASASLAALGYDEKLELDELDTKASTVVATAMSRKSDAGMYSMADLANRLTARLKTGVVPGIQTGFSDLDALTGGLYRGEVTFIGARPSVGKTALALCIAYHIAKTGGIVFFYSLEMTADSLMNRLACIHTGIDHRMVRDGSIADHPEQLGQLLDALGEMSQWPLYVDETPALNIADMQRRALLKAAEVGRPDAIFFDYLQLATVTGAENEYAEVSQASKGMTVTAKLLNTPVVALCQLNRAVEGRRSGRSSEDGEDRPHLPMLSDLRGSGQIEQDASLVIFPYREEMYSDDEDKKGFAELHIAKQRDGRLGIVPLKFDGPRMRFQNLESRFKPMPGY